MPVRAMNGQYADWPLRFPRSSRPLKRIETTVPDRTNTKPARTAKDNHLEAPTARGVSGLRRRSYLSQLRLPPSVAECDLPAPPTPIDRKRTPLTPSHHRP